MDSSIVEITGSVAITFGAAHRVYMYGVAQAQECSA